MEQIVGGTDVRMQVIRKAIGGLVISFQVTRNRWILT